MSEKKPFIDEVLFERIKTGDGSFENILELKKNMNFSIIELVASLQRLEDGNIIIRKKNKFIINNKS